MRTFKDQMHRPVLVEISAEHRVISLVPSQTELLIDLGVNVVGRTKFCVHPADKVKDIPVIGGTKNFRLDRIRELVPTLVVGNKEENYPEGVAEIASHTPVWMSDIREFSDIHTMIRELGIILDRKDRAAEIEASIRESLASIAGQFSGSVLYLIWKDPLMAAGRSTFIDRMLGHLGFENVVSMDRYPEVDSELTPDYVFLSSEPFPFNEKHREKIQGLYPNARVMQVDGEMFSWYGTRLQKASTYFESLVAELNSSIND